MQSALVTFVIASRLLSIRDVAAVSYGRPVGRVSARGPAAGPPPKYEEREASGQVLSFRCVGIVDKLRL